ncbi:helix-turn-helix domain-containing protein [Streptomyces rochei]|uniref:helix-turn-helix domain-containing protein n=1 Tax=Streptomyces rochei TaxID=1928 RepID=UPI0036B80F51
MPYEFRRDDWLSTAEAAALLGVQAVTLRARRSEGRETLPYIKVGQSVLYPRVEVERLALDRGQ